MDYTVTEADRLEAALERDGESDSYEVRLENFEGPLDLLLHLIRKAKIPIEDIFVSQITEQYIAYMEQLKEVDLDRASEFIETAALLLEIKSKSLLPKPPVEEEDPEDAKRELIQRVREYALYKEASAKMKELETVDILYREPDPTVGQVKFVLKDMNMDGLVRALQKLFLKMEQNALKPKERQIQLDRYTVEDRVAYIKDVMLTRPEVSFFDLFEPDYSKTEIITTFQALLELLKLQVVRATQTEVFGDIVIHRTETENGD